MVGVCGGWTFASFTVYNSDGGNNIFSVAPYMLMEHMGQCNTDWRHDQNYCVGNFSQGLGEKVHSVFPTVDASACGNCVETFFAPGANSTIDTCLYNQCTHGQCSSCGPAIMTEMFAACGINDCLSNGDSASCAASPFYCSWSSMFTLCRPCADARQNECSGGCVWDVADSKCIPNIPPTTTSTTEEPTTTTTEEPTTTTTEEPTTTTTEEESSTTTAGLDCGSYSDSTTCNANTPCMWNDNIGCFDGTGCPSFTDVDTCLNDQSCSWRDDIGCYPTDATTPSGSSKWAMTFVIASVISGIAMLAV
jgi:hypothetical protein